MKNQIVKKKRFQLAFASLPKEYHYYVKETNELTICRDCKRWHFEVAGANVTYQKAEIKKVTIFVWDNTKSYHMAVLNAVPDRAIHTAIEQYAYAHYEKGFPAECENWYWNKRENKLVYCPQ